MNDVSVFDSMPVVDERSAPGGNLTREITVIFSDITRYPTEIIDPHADLETDLGIDSVKFGEIFAVLRQRYALPDQEVMKTLPRERFRTVAGIADIVAELGTAKRDIKAVAGAPSRAATSVVPEAPVMAKAPSAAT